MAVRAPAHLTLTLVYVVSVGVLTAAGPGVPSLETLSVYDAGCHAGTALAQRGTSLQCASNVAAECIASCSWTPSLPLCGFPRCMHFWSSGLSVQTCPCWCAGCGPQQARPINKGLYLSSGWGGMPQPSLLLFLRFLGAALSLPTLATEVPVFFFL